MPTKQKRKWCGNFRKDWSNLTGKNKEGWEKVSGDICLIQRIKFAWALVIMIGNCMRLRDRWKEILILRKWGLGIWLCIARLIRLLIIFLRILKIRDRKWFNSKKTKRDLGSIRAITIFIVSYHFLNQQLQNETLYNNIN